MKIAHAPNCNANRGGECNCDGDTQAQLPSRARDERMWCTVCGGRFTEEEIKGWGCPKCGNQGVPCDTAQDVRVEVNWHELHILTVWAENWAQEASRRASADPSSENMPKVVAAIARRLTQQYPELPQLTLCGEVAELPVKLQEMGMGITGVSTNIPRPTMIPVNGPGAVGHAR